MIRAMARADGGGGGGGGGVEPADPLDTMLGYQLRRASAAMLADLTQGLADLSLRVTEASVVLLIDANPTISQSELGRLLGIQRANMAPLAAALTERGIIDRAPLDGRSQALRLNREGRALARAIRQRVAAHEARFLPVLSPAKRAALLALLRGIWRD